MEIEDVLSSIRRLVSEDARPKLRDETAKAAKEPGNRQDKPERLVLTPALRVPDAELSGETPPPARDGGPILLTHPTLVLSEPVVAGARQVPVPPAEPDYVEDGDDTEGLFDSFVEEEVARTLAAEFDAAGFGIDEFEMHSGRSFPAAEPEEATGAELEGEDSETGSRPEAEVAEAPAQAADTPELGLAGKIAALEELIARNRPAPAEPGEGDAAFVHRAQEPLEWEDHDRKPEEPQRETEATVLRGPEWRGTPRPGNDDTALPQTRPEGGAMALVDEEMVRGMVSDMIRQELQGALGERITRNVRKLVRREIHRMAMSKDYE
ncbi:conserved hypothetical protein [Citreicella sp. SE45]|nr:conserved hypothetical protein [Citreicella sp. SE45]